MGPAGAAREHGVTGEHTCAGPPRPGGTARRGPEAGGELWSGVRREPNSGKRVSHSPHPDRPLPQHPELGTSAASVIPLSPEAGTRPLPQTPSFQQPPAHVDLIRQKFQTSLKIKFVLKNAPFLKFQLWFQDTFSQERQSVC